MFSQQKQKQKKKRMTLGLVELSSAQKNEMELREKESEQEKDTTKSVECAEKYEINLEIMQDKFEEGQLGFLEKILLQNPAKTRKVTKPW